MGGMSSCRMPPHSVSDDEILTSGEVRMEQSHTLVQYTLRSLRIVHAAFLFSVALCAVIVVLITPHPSQQLKGSILIGAGAFTLIFLAVGFLMRLTFLQPNLEKLGTNSEDVDALARWRLASVVSAVVAEMSALVGVAVHFAGGTSTQSAIFIALSAVVMLLWWPRQP